MIPVFVDSCGWLEWFTDSKKIADVYNEYLVDSDLKGLDNVIFIPKPPPNVPLSELTLQRWSNLKEAIKNIQP